MTSEEFLLALEERQWLSTSLMERLQAKVADSARPFHAQALAKFLVEKGHLTTEQAEELLGPAVVPRPEMVLAADPLPAGPKPPKPPKRSRKPVNLADELAQSEQDAQRWLAGGKSASRTKLKTRAKKSGKNPNEWDSPLLLVGGGALVLLVLGGIVVGYFLTRESGDELLAQARSHMQSGSYTNAISLYDQFVQDHTGHPDHGEARVNLALAKLRQATEANNFPVALEMAQSEIGHVEGEEKFSVAQGELAALLPRIALGLAGVAESESDPAKVAEKTALAQEALALCSNTQYIPKSMRGPEIEEVQATLDRIARRQKAHEELNATIAAMEQANTAGDTAKAYEAYEVLLTANPELAGNKQLLAVVKTTSQAERAGIKFVEAPQAAATSERQSPIVTELALADRRATAPAPATGVAAVLVDGAVYGLDVASGKLLWRKYVGIGENHFQPVVAGDDFLCVDATTQELLRLNQPRGELVWRAPIDEQVAQPVVVGNRVFLAGESGRLHVFELGSGNRLGHIKLTQPLRVAPTVDPSGKRFYLVGDHSSLYTLSVDDLSCLGVFYLGHDRGTVVASPAVILNKLAVCENDGVETSRLHLFELDADGVVSRPLGEQRLSGLVTQQPLVEGRRLTVVTDRGQVCIYDVASSGDDAAWNRIAAREPTRREPIIASASSAVRHLWITDNHLGKFSVDPTNARIAARTIPDNFANSAFLTPPIVFGDVLVHARRRGGDPSVIVTATQGQSGATLWETAVGLRPAGGPAAAGNTRGLLLGTAGGKVFLFDRVAIAARVQDTPLPGNSMPSTAKPLEFRHALPGGRMVLSATESPDVLLYDPSTTDSSLRWIQLPSPLACEPTPFGQGWLAPLEVGQILLLDGAGDPLAAPFQPTLKPGVAKKWLPASVVDEQQVVVSDTMDAIYRVELRTAPQPHLAAANAAALGASGATTRPAVLNGNVYVGGKDARLVTFALPALEAGDAIVLPDDVVWGPYTVGDRLLLATADGKLLALAADGSTAWQHETKLAPLGTPLVVEDSVLLCFADGVLWKLKAASGEEVARIEVAQPLAAGPTAFEQRFAVATTDGAVLIVNVP